MKLKTIGSIFLLIILAYGCTPGKTNQVVSVHAYCDSCDIKIVNRAVTGNNNYEEVLYDGIFTSSLIIESYRFDADATCIQVKRYNQYTSNTAYYYIIENNDTIFSGSGTGEEVVSYGFCY